MEITRDFVILSCPSFNSNQGKISVYSRISMELVY